MIDTLGVTHDVPDEHIDARIAQGWRPQTTDDVLASANASANEAAYGGVGGAVRAGFEGLARGISLGGYDVLAGAIGGEDAAIGLAGRRAENPITSTLTEIGGNVAPILLSGGAGALGAAARLTPAGLAGRAGASVGVAAGGGLRGALAAGAVEGGLSGVGSGTTELALSNDKLTWERAASAIGSNALFGAGIGAAAGGAFNAVERGLSRAATAIDDHVAERATRRSVESDLVGLDRKGLVAAEDAELARIEAARVGHRAEVADEIAAFREDLRGQKIWLTTKKGADEVPPAAGAPESVPSDAPEWNPDSSSGGAPVGEFGPIEVRPVGRPSQRQFEAVMPDGTTRPLNGRGEVSDLLEAQMPDGFRPGAGVETHRRFRVERTLPASHDSITDNAIYVVRPSELAERGLMGNELKPANRDSILKAWSEGKRLDPIDIDVPSDGRFFVEDGNHRLQAAARSDRPVAVHLRRVDSDAGWKQQANAHDISDRIKAELPAPPAPLAPSVGVGPSTPSTPAPTASPPQIEGLGPLGKRLLKTDRALDRLLDNPKALAARPQRALDALQMQEAAYEDLLGKSNDLRIKFAADTSGDRIAALDAIPAALERNRALQSRIGELLQAPRTPRLDEITAARDVLNQPAKPKSMVEQAFGGTMFGAISGAVGSIPVLGQIPGVAQFVGAKGAELASRLVFGKLNGAVGAQAERAGKAVKALLSATKTTERYAPVVASKVLAKLRYGNEKRDKEPTTLPELYKARTDEVKQLTAYDETGMPRVRPDVRERIGKALHPIAVIDPIAADRIETHKVRGIEYLSSIIPRRPDIAGVPVGPDNWQPSDMAMRSWARSAEAVEDPYGVLERALHGAVTPEDARAMREVHIEILNDFTNNVMSQLPELRQSLPYDRQLALSILTGKAVTPALDPQILSVLQSQFPDEPGSEGGTQAPKAQPQFGSISKSVSQPTPAQSRAQGAHV